MWAALGVTVALGRAFAEIWDVPHLERPSGLNARARGLLVLLIFGATLVATTGTTRLLSSEAGAVELAVAFGQAALEARC